MSWFTKAVGFFTGGSKTADTLVDGAVRGIDALYFSPEEKAHMSKEAFELYLKYQEATAPQNVARRQLALGVVATYLILVVLGVIVFPFMETYSDFIFKVLSEVLHWPVITIIGFYFLKRMKVLKDG